MTRQGENCDENDQRNHDRVQSRGA
jgi:hypothetical protein